jgi:hypothetical protein
MLPFYVPVATHGGTKKERYTKVEMYQELGINLATLWKW